MAWRIEQVGKNEEQVSENEGIVWVFDNNNNIVCKCQSNNGKLIIERMNKLDAAIEGLNNIKRIVDPSAPLLVEKSIEQEAWDEYLHETHPEKPLDNADIVQKVSHEVHETLKKLGLD